jgi:hypothetical protein
VASLLFSLVDRGRRGRPCSRVLLPAAGRSPQWPVVGPLDPAMPRPDLEAARRGRAFLVVDGGRTRTAATAAMVGVVAARPVRGGLRSSTGDVRPRGGGSAAGVAFSSGGARRPASGALQRRWPTSCVVVPRWGRSAVACGVVSTSWLPVASSRAWWPPAPGGKSHEWRRRWSGFSVLRLGWRRLAGGSRPSEPTLLGLSVGDGFSLPISLPRRVRRWSVLVGDLGRPRAHVRTYLVA